MNYEIHFDRLMEKAEDLRYRSYETFEFVELNDSHVLLKIFSYNHGARLYLANVWEGVWTDLGDLPWIPMKVGND